MVVEPIDPSEHFPLPLGGRFQDNGRMLLLTEPFKFVDGDEVVEIPYGFLTDFNSVPRPLWTWFPPWQFPEAGVVHDWLYRYPGERSRQRCDEIHRRILHLKGCRKSKRVAAYLGMRAGGWKPWNEYRAQEKAAANV